MNQAKSVKHSVSGGKMTIDGKPVVRRLGATCGYYQTIDGRYWLLNEQKGFVQVPETSRALMYARAFHPGSL